jgi:hypothetical protein
MRGATVGTRPDGLNRGPSALLAPVSSSTSSLRRVPTAVDSDTR